MKQAKVALLNMWIVSFAFRTHTRTFSFETVSPSRPLPPLHLSRLLSPYSLAPRRLFHPVLHVPPQKKRHFMNLNLTMEPIMHCKTLNNNILLLAHSSLMPSLTLPLYIYLFIYYIDDIHLLTSCCFEMSTVVMLLKYNMEKHGNQSIVIPASRSMKDRTNKKTHWACRFARCSLWLVCICHFLSFVVRSVYALHFIFTIRPCDHHLNRYYIKSYLSINMKGMCVCFYFRFWFQSIKYHMYTCWYGMEWWSFGLFLSISASNWIDFSVSFPLLSNGNIQCPFEWIWMKKKKTIVLFHECDCLRCSGGWMVMFCVCCCFTFFFVQQFSFLVCNFNLDY